MQSMSFEKSFDCQPVSLCSHPERPLFAVGLVDGTVGLYSCQAGASGSEEEEAIVELWTRKHKAAVRKVRSSADGSSVLTITSNLALCMWDVASGRKKRCIQRSHEHRPYALCVMDENQAATGDETGEVRLWDWRNRVPCVATIHDDLDDYVTDLAADLTRNTLLATCGDGTLSAFNIAKRKLDVQSEVMQSELLSVAIVLNGKRVICGGAVGYLEVFNWNEWGNILERIYAGHKDSVDCLCVADEDLVICGSMNGYLQQMRVLPNQLGSVVGSHDGAVEDLAIACDRKHIISCGDDNKVKFWANERTRKNIAKQSKRSRPIRSLKEQLKHSKARFFEGLEFTEDSRQEDGDEEQKEQSQS